VGGVDGHVGVAMPGLPRQKDIDHPAPILPPIATDWRPEHLLAGYEGNVADVQGLAGDYGLGQPEGVAHNPRAVLSDHGSLARELILRERVPDLRRILRQELRIRGRGSWGWGSRVLRGLRLDQRCRW